MNNHLEEHDRECMRLALAQGRRALPGCLPNPPVGCVMTANGMLVASGFTQPPGEPHAEAMALAQLAGATAELAASVLGTRSEVARFVDEFAPVDPDQDASDVLLPS